jgi:hypothetical protein
MRFGISETLAAHCDKGLWICAPIVDPHKYSHGSFEFGVGCILVDVEHRTLHGDGTANLTAAFQHFQLAESAFQPSRRTLSTGNWEIGRIPFR